MAVWVLLVGVVVVLSLLPGSMVTVRALGGSADHLVAYLSLAVLPSAGARRGRGVGVAIAFVLGLGIALELAQTRVPGRAFEWGDIAANSAGVAVGTVAGWLLRGR